MRNKGNDLKDDCAKCMTIEDESVVGREQD